MPGPTKPKVLVAATFRRPTGPPPAVNRTTKPRPLFAAVIKHAPQACVPKPSAQQMGGDAKKKSLLTPKFVTKGPSRKQVLITFMARDVPHADIENIYQEVNGAFTWSGRVIRALSCGHTFNGYTVECTQVAADQDINTVKSIACNSPHWCPRLHCARKCTSSATPRWLLLRLSISIYGTPKTEAGLNSSLAGP
ncbi:hypothetical protein BJ165DRAFT_1531509 [Panaeolus papilionaceus]|nr:hypothetical protein BJ165DRAFT_1531509 [Panaeolus papilionaceus]